MILLKNISLSFGNQTIFHNLTVHLQKRWRVGLFGLNGAGKSTLLEVIVGMQPLDKGTVVTEKGARIAYMPQEVVLHSDCAVVEETMKTFDELIILQQRLRAVEKRLGQAPENLRLIEEYAEISQLLMQQEPARKRAECERVLTGLGFTHTQLQVSVNTLSVGWKMRIVLAQLLLKKADFYLFDEPTNHLDIVAKEWFLRFLRQSTAGFLLVCHEKYFLNTLCTHVLELAQGIGTLYTGNYEKYCAQKEADNERLQGAFEQQQREIEHMQKVINKFKAGTRASQAKSMEKKLEKIERIVLPLTSKTVSFSFATPEPSGREVLTVKDLACGFDSHIIFSHCSFLVERMQRIAIVAPNGTGKTTLLSALIKKIVPCKGTIEWGTNVRTAFFDQDQLRSLEKEKTVWENALTGSSAVSTKQIRTILGSFLFNEDAIKKKVEVLSGGERNRLGMVRVLLQNANVLLLDEPTNHLDIPSKELLLQALLAYQGTILFVSHDQDFVNRLATHIIELTPMRTRLYHGSYDDYLYQKSVTEGAESGMILLKKESQKPTHDQHKQTQEQIVRLEKTIQNIERDIKKVEKEFEAAVYGTSFFTKLQEKMVYLQKELENCMYEWERLHS